MPYTHGAHRLFVFVPRRLLPPFSHILTVVLYHYSGVRERTEKSSIRAIRTDPSPHGITNLNPRTEILPSFKPVVLRWVRKLSGRLF